jgi:hypothetical protein
MYPRANSHIASDNHDGKIHQRSLPRIIGTSNQVSIHIRQKSMKPGNLVRVAPLGNAWGSANGME